MDPNPMEPFMQQDPMQMQQNYQQLPKQMDMSQFQQPIPELNQDPMGEEMDDRVTFKVPITTSGKWSPISLGDVKEFE
jgi:hypothetical protein